MNKYLISYWKETNDEKDLFEREAEANSIDEAFATFRSKNPFVKIDSIELLTKSVFSIRRRISRSVLENIFVTAIEGGSNYWYYLSDDAVKLIRKAVPKDVEPYIALAMFKAVLDYNVEVPINDAEDEDEVIGYISNQTIQKRLNDLSNDEGLRWCLDKELSDNGDAETSDVVFQFLTMGDYVYC